MMEKTPMQTGLGSTIAMPLTGRLIGTPASIMLRQPPHTVAIDDEPFDSVMSDRTRIV